MTTFIDAEGREWTLQLDAMAILEVREACDPKFCLNEDSDDNTFVRLDRDPVLLCGVLYILTREQREQRQIDQRDFYLSLCGDVIDAAGAALSKAILNFTSRKTRAVLEAGAAMRERLQAHGTERIKARISDPALEQQLKDNLDRQIDEALARMLTPSKSASNSPATSVSTPKD